MDRFAREIQRLRPAFWARSGPTGIRDLVSGKQLTVSGTSLLAAPGPGSMLRGAMRIGFTADDALYIGSGMTGFPTGNDPRTLYGVIRTTGFGAEDPWLSYGDGGGGGQEFIVEVGNYSFTDGINVGNNVGAQAGYSDLATGPWYAVAVTHDGATMRFWRGAREGGSMGLARSFATQQGAVRIGNRTDSGNAPFHGVIADVVIFPRVLSRTDFQRLEMARLARVA